jgi:hypothetical protein
MTPPADTITGIVARVVRPLADPLSLASLPPRELDLTIRLLRRARLLGRVAFRLQRAGQLDALPHPLPDHLHSSLVSAEARRRAALWEMDRISVAIGGPGIRPIALKGCAYLLGGLPNAGGRSFADVDLLLPAGQLAEVERRLLRQGWRADALSAYDEHYYRHWAHELPPLTHVERDVEVDLHHNLVMPTGRLRPDASLLVAAARTVPGMPYRTLAPVDMVLHAAIHLFQGGELADGLRELVDIADLLTHFAEHEPGFWPSFWPRAEQLGLTRPAFYALRYAQRWLGVQLPPEVAGAAAAALPPAPVLAVMDRLVPLALFPLHPDRPGRFVGPARLGLFVRSHWVRMPPPMLARHLGYKFYLRVLERTGRASRA